MAVASAGISNMQEELSSKNPGDAITSAPVSAPASSPLARQTMTKTQTSSMRCERRCYQPRPQNARTHMLEHLRHQPRMQRRLVVPHLAVEPVAVQAKRRLGHLKPFIRPNLNRRPQRNPAFEHNKPSQQNCCDHYRRRPRAALDCRTRCRGLPQNGLADGNALDSAVEQQRHEGAKVGNKAMHCVSPKLRALT